MGVRDVLETLRGPTLYEINKGFGLTTCEGNRFEEASVLMLSYNRPNLSMRQFMKYICNAYKVHSILLQCFALESQSHDLKSDNLKLLEGICKCERKNCKCIVFWNVEEIIMVLARRMPGTFKLLSDSLCLLPCPDCRETGCHGCNQDQYVEETDEFGRKILTEDGSKIVAAKSVVAEIFHYISEGSMKVDSCICIQLSPSSYAYWTKLVIRSFEATEDTTYRTASLIMPSLTEVLLNFLLTGRFGSGFAANAFLIKAMVKDNRRMCQLDSLHKLGGACCFSRRLQKMV